ITSHLVGFFKSLFSSTFRQWSMEQHSRYAMPHSIGMTFLRSLAGLQVSILVGTKLTLARFRFWLHPGGSFTSWRALIPMLASLSVTASCSRLILADTQTLLKKKRKRHMSSFTSPSTGMLQK